ncbi:MAG: methyltransferase domain-containing protein [Bacilli bacterium]|jgi:hypothetical protein
MRKTKEELLKEWLEEEKVANIKGWDFSHINDRYEEEDNLPWDLLVIIKKYLKPNMRLLDMETGGGEFLPSFNHPFNLTSAIEAYPPNVEYCKEKLMPLGIDFKEADGEDDLPFTDEYFQMITNRHGSYKPAELKRLLSKGGYFITQQVGAENDRKLIELLTPENKDYAFPNARLEIAEQALIEQGFEILEKGEEFLPIKFYDVGALVWFARIIEWEFEGFSVKTHLENLYKAQEILEEKGVIEGKIHRFYLVAKKK